MEPKWLEWAKRLQAIAQNGLTFASNPFDIERYQAVLQIAAEMMSTDTDVETSQVVEFFAKETGYATPKVDVRAAVFRDEAILLVKERADEGRWTLPGGWADVCESPSESVVREVYEESGFQTRAVKLIAVYDRSKHPHIPPFPYHVYKIFFLCKIIDGEPSTSFETEAVGFFGEHELPELSITRVTPAQIAQMFKHHRQPDLPTEFD